MGIARTLFNTKKTLSAIFSMKYKILLEQLYSRTASQGLKLGLDNMHTMTKALGDPQHSFKSIHVAGTNGKGSVCTKIATALELEGYKVGLYTSPHISTYRERIQINRCLISEESISDLLQYLLKLVDELEIPASFFEITTLAALKYFSEQKVDYAVFETGLGGRLDATNIVTPILSIITSISYDHMELLGNTLESIAREKAGIIKPYTPVVLGPSVPVSIMQPIAECLNSPWEQLHGTYATFDIENSEIARMALKHLPVSYASVEQGLSALPPCRLACYRPEDLTNSHVADLPQWVVLDVAHNPDGLLKMFKALQAKFPSQKIRILCSLSKSKDLKACLTIIRAHAQSLELTQAASQRAAPVEELIAVLSEAGMPEDQYFVHAFPEEGIKSALKNASLSEEILVICGTFFIMSQARNILGLCDPHDAIPLGLQETYNPDLTTRSENLQKF